MMTCSRSAPTFLLLSLIASPIFAADISVSAGHTNKSSNLFRVSTQTDLDIRWLESRSGHLSAYWDATYSYWQGHKSASRHSLSTSPVLVYEFNGERFKPYIEGGIGIALFSASRVEKQKLGTAFQFEDRLGAGVRFAGQALGVRFWHYSNAGLKSANDGINAYSLHYRFHF